MYMTHFCSLLRLSIISCKIAIYFIAISPAPARWNLWQDAKEVNHRIKEYAKQHHQVVFIETDFYFLNENKKPVISLFAKDGIHLNNDGYAIWKKLVSATIIKPL